MENRNLIEIKEKRDLSHDGGRLLVWAIKRLGIAREDWVHTYCYGSPNKKLIPTIKHERKEYLVPFVDRLIGVIKLNLPCVVVGMGKLTSEVLTGASNLKNKVNTDWTMPWGEIKKLGIRKVWITNSPDAALYNPELLVGMWWVLCNAAEEANIPIEIDYQLKMFDFSKYTK